MRGTLAAGLSAPALAALLEACGSNSSTTATEVKIPSPSTPVTWPLSEANPAIAAGQTPKAGSTLRIYNYADYLSPRVLKDFEAKYDVDIRLSTFNDADEALTKVASKDLKFDLYFPSYDSLGKLIQADLLRPLTARLPHELRQPVVELPRPLVRPRGPLHGALHDLLHRHRLAYRHGPHRHRRDGQPLRRPVGQDLRRQHGDPRRLAHSDVHGAAAQRGDGPQLHVVLRPRHDPHPAPRPAQDDAAEGHDLDVHRDAGRPVRPVPDVVR